MKMLTNLPGLGVDVAKDWLDVFDGNELIRISNSQTAIKQFIASRKEAVPVAIESTNRYHELFVKLAMSAGYCVYLIDAFRFSRYRDAVGARSKTDAVDAKVLYRYVCSEAPNLKPYQLPPKPTKRLITLLQARGRLALSKSRIRQSLENISELVATRNALLARIDRAIELIDKKLQSCIKNSGYSQDYQRCLDIPGVGPINAAALVAFYHRGVFIKADAFVAYMGLDIRARESGRFKGKRKLSKRGNPEMRRLLFNAARAGARTKAWNTCYLAFRERGLSSTAATVAISRKIAKLAFVLMRDKSKYQQKIA